MQKENKSAKSLNFDDNHTYLSIPNREEIENKQQVWYSDEELRVTMTECMQTIAAMQGGIPFGENEIDSYTCRGLEHFTSDGFQIANSSREAVQLVLQEQERQRQECGSVDPNLLAAAIESVSRHRLRIAQLTGLKDERAAKNIIHNTDDAKNSAWGEATTNNNLGAATDEVRKRIAERRKFRGGSNRRSLDSMEAPARATSDTTTSSAARRPRASHRVRIRNQQPQRAASLDIHLLWWSIILVLWKKEGSTIICRHFKVAIYVGLSIVNAIGAGIILWCDFLVATNLPSIKEKQISCQAQNEAETWLLMPTLPWFLCGAMATLFIWLGYLYYGHDSQECPGAARTWAAEKLGINLRFIWWCWHKSKYYHDFASKLKIIIVDNTQ